MDLNNTQGLGNIFLGLSSIFEADSYKKSADFEARQMEREAKAELAEGSIAAREEAERGRLLESKYKAAMAASGGVTTDAQSGVDLEEIQESAQENVLTALSNAERRSEKLKIQAEETRKSGRRKKRAALIRGFGRAGLGAYQSYQGRQDPNRELRSRRGV
jgi:hypothetical protein